MKTIIIVINILLLSLILYNLLDKGEKVLENMAGCPDSGAAGTNKRLIDRLYQEVATTDAETDELNTKIKNINDFAETQEKRQKAFMQDVNNQQKAAGKELGITNNETRKVLLNFLRNYGIWKITSKYVRKRILILNNNI